MDLEEQKLAEDIEQIELVLKASDNRRAQSSLHIVDEEVDSDNDDELTISVDRGLYRSNEAEPGTSGLNSRHGTSGLIENELELYQYGEELEEEEEDLGDTLETALKLNRAYQELLRSHMATIKELLSKNAAKQRSGQEQLITDMTEKYKPLREYDIFNYPYFKDRYKNGPPKNIDCAMRESLFPRIEPPRIWRVYQEEILLKCLTEQMKTKCLKDLHLRLRRCRQGVSETGQEVENEANLMYTIDCVRSSFALGDVPVEDIISHADWLIIANNHLDGAFSTESCIAMYRNICNPLINRSKWSQAEDQKLKDLVTKLGHQNWMEVAKQLGTNRSAFLCLQRYQQALNDYETAPWTAEKVDALNRYMSATLGMEDVISWDKAAWYIGDMTPSECKTFWETAEWGGRRKFSEEEDDALREAVLMYESKADERGRWMFVAATVGTRNSMQCRERWVNRLAPGLKYYRWFPSEDKILFDYLKKFEEEAKGMPKEYKYDLKSLKVHFPDRVNNSIGQRLRYIKNKMEKGIVTEDHLEKAIGNENEAKRLAEIEAAEADHKKLENEIEENGRPSQSENNEQDGASEAIANDDSKKVVSGKRVRRGKFSGSYKSFLDESSSHPRRRSLLTSSWMKGTQTTVRGNEEMQIAAEKFEEMEINKCLDILLAGYPLKVSASRTLLSSLETSIRCMLNKPLFLLQPHSVGLFLKRKCRRFALLRKVRDVKIQELRMKRIDEVATEQMAMPYFPPSPLPPPVRRAPKRKFRLKKKPTMLPKKPKEMIAAIVSLLTAEQTTPLSEEARGRYLYLSQQSLDKVDMREVNEKRIQYAESTEGEVKDLPYLLPPNQVTLGAFYHLSRLKHKLNYYAYYPQSMGKEIFNTQVEQIKETPGYKAIRDRMMSMFFWPAALSKCNPKAAVHEAMCVRHYKPRRKAPCTSATEGRPKNQVSGNDVLVTNPSIQNTITEGQVIAIDLSSDGTPSGVVINPGAGDLVDIDSPASGWRSDLTELLPSSVMRRSKMINAVESVISSIRPARPATAEGEESTANEEASVTSTPDLTTTVTPSPGLPSPVTATAAKKSDSKMKDLLFNVSASSKRSGKKLPNDVAAIILKSLQERSNNPIIKPDIKQYVLRKPLSGPYDTVVLQLVTEDPTIVNSIARNTRNKHGEQKENELMAGRKDAKQNSSSLQADEENGQEKHNRKRKSQIDPGEETANTSAKQQKTRARKTSVDSNTIKPGDPAYGQADHNIQGTFTAPSSMNADKVKKQRKPRAKKNTTGTTSQDTINLLSEKVTVKETPVKSSDKTAPSKVSKQPLNENSVPNILAPARSPKRVPEKSPKSSPRRSSVSSKSLATSASSTKQVIPLPSFQEAFVPKHPLSSSFTSCTNTLVHGHSNETPSNTTETPSPLRTRSSPRKQSHPRKSSVSPTKVSALPFHQDSNLGGDSLSLQSLRSPDSAAKTNAEKIKSVLQNIQRKSSAVTPEESSSMVMVKRKQPALNSVEGVAGLVEANAILKEPVREEAESKEINSSKVGNMLHVNEAEEVEVSTRRLSQVDKAKEIEMTTSSEEAKVSKVGELSQIDIAEASSSGTKTAAHDTNVPSSLSSGGTSDKDGQKREASPTEGSDPVDPKPLFKSWESRLPCSENILLPESEYLGLYTNVLRKRPAPSTVTALQSMEKFESDEDPDGLTDDSDNDEDYTPATDVPFFRKRAPLF